MSHLYRNQHKTYTNGQLCITSSGAISRMESLEILQCSKNCLSSLIALTNNWQTTKSMVRERNASMFNNELMSDVQFIVGPSGSSRVIPAHKYVLAIGSSVFYAMFYGSLAECKKEIYLPDIEPSSFLVLLRYLYCDEINLEPETIFPTLYVAKKYIVPQLVLACVSYLETNLSAKNACLFLSQSILFEEQELIEKCWDVIDAQTEVALKAEGFLDIDISILKYILRRETLSCKELYILEATLRWSNAECFRQDLDITSRNKRIVLGDALYLIRIPTLTLREFADFADQQDVLTRQEILDIFLYYAASNKPILPYPVKPRAGLSSKVCHRFQSYAYRSNQWRYRGCCDSIKFAVDKKIFFLGIGLYGSSNGAATYNVKITLHRLNTQLAEKNTNFVSDGTMKTIYVLFDNSIQIDAHSYYTICATIHGPQLSFFGQKGMMEVTAGSVKFQFQPSSQSTNGTGVQGGQIPEIIFYGPKEIQN